MVVTLQIDVARRLAAKAGEADYGLLTLLVQLQYQPFGCFKIPATCFFPRPEVDSACVTLCRRQPPLLPPALRPAFVKIVKRSFSQRRKMMLKLLSADWNEADLEPAFQHCGLQRTFRAEHVRL